jgi:hypothetical protein
MIQDVIVSMLNLFLLCSMFKFRTLPTFNDSQTGWTDFEFEVSKQRQRGLKSAAEYVPPVR